MPMWVLCLEKLAVRGGHFRVGGISLTSSARDSTPRMTQAGSAVIHTPDRSGLPFVKRGVAANKSTSPFAVRGARGLGCLNHWASTWRNGPAIAIISITTNTRLRMHRQAHVSICMRVLCDGRRRAAHRRMRYLV